MLEFGNNHIFTGYLKQLLASFNLPTCKVYTKEFAKYAAAHGQEDPRIVESFDSISSNRLATRIGYLKGNELYNFFYDHNTEKTTWRKQTNIFYTRDKKIPGLTRTLKSPGTSYDYTTHEYLGDLLRFIRDYYNVNLMPLYNCFSNRTCNNIYLVKTKVKEDASGNKETIELARFDSGDPKYKIYAIPVKLFEKYTIAMDCDQGIELFCGIYGRTLDTSEKAQNLFDKTYLKISKTSFKQPFLYDKLLVGNWMRESTADLESSKIMSRCDILGREQDLKLFIKIPISCISSITILEGDYRFYNDFKYTPGVLPTTSNAAVRREIWDYQSNRTIINFDKKLDLNDQDYPLISRLQLLAINTGRPYPFSDRLIEYLTGSATSPIDGIHDNIHRAQKIMNQNDHYFKIIGRWEDKMQKIAYNYMINEGPFEVSTETDTKGNTKHTISDKKTGRHPKLGYNSKSTMYDILGFIDRDVERCYASWTIKDGKLTIYDTIQHVDIYNGLYDF